jgi:hypothetical protein
LFSVDLIGPVLVLPRGGVYAVLTSIVCFALFSAVQGKLFFLNSTTAQAGASFVETGYVDGYWEAEGEWEVSLELVIDQISQSCGLNPSYTKMDKGDGSQLNQQINAGECKSAALKVGWLPAQMSQFDPQSPNTILNILSSVRMSAFRPEE